MYSFQNDKDAIQMATGTKFSDILGGFLLEVSRSFQEGGISSTYEQIPANLDIMKIEVEEVPEPEPLSVEEIEEIIVGACEGIEDITDNKFLKKLKKMLHGIDTKEIRAHISRLSNEGRLRTPEEE